MQEHALKFQFGLHGARHLDFAAGNAPIPWWIGKNGIIIKITEIRTDKVGHTVSTASQCNQTIRKPVA